ncbi:MAG: ribosomal protection-like ABC-F family protein, partial [Erysipelotrichaceae bacterium]
SISTNHPHWRLLKELSLLEVSEEVLTRPFDTLSSGEQTKVMLATLFVKDNAFLLIDEPTNHLDSLGRKIVSSYLSKKTGFILVSHDRVFLDECVDHILSINKANIEIERGTFSSWWANKTKRDEREQAENERLKGEIKKLQKSAREKADWSDKVEKTKYGTRNSGLRVDRGYIGHKAAKMMKRSKNIERRQEQAIATKANLLKNVESAETLKLAQLPFHSSTLIEVAQLRIAYGETIACDNVSFTVEKGERVLLSGPNGSGKSSILKRLCGESLHHQGTLRIHPQLKISYVSQDTSALCGSLDDYVLEQGIDRTLFKAILRKLDFERSQFDQKLEYYSGGQKKKVLLAKSLCEQAHLLIWDEPLNFIDVISRMQIEQLLLDAKPTILFVEHDQAFCDAIATKIIAL